MKMIYQDFYYHYQNISEEEILDLLDRDENIEQYLHREDGPAVHSIKDNYIYEVWFYNGKKHRIGKPAIETPHFTEWYENGKLHRIAGPAIIYNNHDEFYYIWGENYSKEDYNQLMEYLKENGEVAFRLEYYR